MPSIDEAAESLVAMDRPVLFVDTCIFLDIVRSTHRGLRDYAALASELLKLVSDSPATCALVVSSIVPQEWNDNAPAVTQETSQLLRKMEEQSSHFHDACQALGIAVATPRTRYGQSGLAEALRDLSRSLIDRAIQLDADDMCHSRAVARVIKRTPPALRNEVKDSAIIEEYLAVCRGLQGTGFARKRVFCTSNTRDYCEAAGGLHSQLAGDFAGCSLIFTTNLPWALHEITH
jgi:hypothetical protein